MILFYYFVLKPLKLLPITQEQNEKYDDADLHPRFSFFEVRMHTRLLFLFCKLHYDVLMDFQNDRQCVLRL